MGRRYGLIRKSAGRPQFVWRIFSLCLALIGLPMQTVWAQTTPTPEPPSDASSMAAERVLELTLEDAIHLALQQNLDLERERFSPRIEQTEVGKARAAFDPAIGLDATLSQTKSLSVTEVKSDPNNPDVFIPLKRFNKDGAVGLRFSQRIVTGGNYEIRFENTRNNTSPTQSGVNQSTRTIEDPRYESAVQLTFTQPLLKGFGIAVNRAPIEQARNTTAIADQQVIQVILNTVYEVQQAYWNLVFQMQDLIAKQESQKLAEDFLAENKVRVELGTLAPIELVQAETRVKTREGEVILAEAAVEEAEDRLKEVLNLPATIEEWVLRIRPVDSPSFVPNTQILVRDRVEQALKSRPDFLQSQLQIDTLEIDRQVAQNRLLPELDLQAVGRVDAFSGDFPGSAADLDQANGYYWSFGLTVEYPLGNRFARQDLRKRQLLIKQARVDQRKLRQVIVREVRQAIRAIETASKRVEVTRSATRLAKTQLEAEQEKFRLGLSTSFVVLDFQGELTNARSDEIRAISNYNIALAQLDQITGTLRYGEVKPENFKGKEKP